MPATITYNSGVANLNTVLEGSRIITTTVAPTGYPTGLNGNACMVIQYGGGDFMVQLAFSFGSEKLAIRRKFNSSN